MRKYVKFIVLGVSVVVIGLYMSTTYKPRVTEVDPVVAREENSFDQKLDEYNVTVQGSSSYLSRFQLKGFINMMDMVPC